jgi:hypothetical protein
LKLKEVWLYLCALYAVVTQIRHIDQFINNLLCAMFLLLLTCNTVGDVGVVIHLLLRNELLKE